MSSTIQLLVAVSNRDCGVRRSDDERGRRQVLKSVFRRVPPVRLFMREGNKATLSRRRGVDLPSDQVLILDSGQPPATPRSDPRKSTPAAPRRPVGQRRRSVAGQSIHHSVATRDGQRSLGDLAAETPAVGLSSWRSARPSHSRRHYTPACAATSRWTARQQQRLVAQHLHQVFSNRHLLLTAVPLT